MYEDDRPARPAASRLRPDLVRELVFASHLRPRIARHLIDELEAKLQRTAPGYAPRSGLELLEWVKERWALPADEWRALLAAIERDHGVDPGTELAAVASRLVAWQTRTGGPALVSAVESLPALAVALGRPLGSLRLSTAVLDGGAADAAGAALAHMVAAPSFEAPETTLAELLAGWLAGFGPVDPDWIAAALDVEPEAVAMALDELAELQAVLLDQISEGATAIEVCDRENLERLLRMARRAARPSFRTQPPELLPLWLAHHQGLARRDATLDDLKAAIERLVACPLAVELIETEILPARVDPYHPAWLDALLAETELEWFGCGERRIAFGLAGDRDLAVDDPLADGPRAEGGPEPADPLLPGELGRYSFTDLLRRSGAESGQLLETLWSAAWRGEVAADSFAPLRHGAAAGFEAAPVELETPLSRRRPSFDRWRSRLPVAGNWFRLPRPTATGDALDREEADRDRARLLLERYGLLFRELVERELPAMRWGAIFRSLRMLELAGEVIAGRFFDGVPGLQFMTRAAFRELEEGLPEDLVWWLNAADPASPCGLPAIDLGLQLPRRIPSNHLVFHGRRLVLVSERRGARLTIAVGPDHPRLADYLGVLKAQLGRSVQPRGAITVDEINGQPAGASPYRSALQELFQVTRTPNALKLARRY